MQLCYRDPGLKYSIDSIMLFQGEDTSLSWRESLFHFYPQLDQRHFDALQAEEKPAYLRSILRTVYAQEALSIAAKIDKYNQHWHLHKPQIEAAFTAAFHLDCRNSFNHLTGNITLNPICPRFLDSHTFDVFYLNSERGALGIALHEMIHFLWFHVWQQQFHDDVGEYETPHLKWIFSEMAVDPIMRKDSRLGELNPYFDDGCAYEYFYSMRIDGTPILETLYDLYTNTTMPKFMEQGYAYCAAHEAEIRAQMH